MNTEQPYLSVIVPVYNESKRIAAVATISEYLNRQSFTHELIIVDDGSTDDTLTKLGALHTQSLFQTVNYPTNHGKGFAIQQGMLAARGKYRLFMDVDLSTPIEELESFLPHLATCDVVIASRRRSKTSIVVHQPKLRETLGRGFTWLSQVILQVPLSDFTCGFKCFSDRAAQGIFPRMTIERWGFDAEIMFIAHYLKFSIKEVPVKWTNDPRTKVKLPGDILISLRDLLTIRFNALNGKYRQEHAK